MEETKQIEEQQSQQETTKIEETVETEVKKKEYVYDTPENREISKTNKIK